MKTSWCSSSHLSWRCTHPHRSKRGPSTYQATLAARLDWAVRLLNFQDELQTLERIAACGVILACSPREAFDEAQAHSAAKLSLQYSPSNVLRGPNELSGNLDVRTFGARVHRQDAARMRCQPVGVPLIASRVPISPTSWWRRYIRASTEPTSIPNMLLHMNSQGPERRSACSFAGDRHSCRSSLLKFLPTI